MPRVVVASGRYNLPDIPPVDGLDTFDGEGGISHAFRYKDPDRYRGQTVVVCGGSISALEIASDLAMIGADVHLAQRRQRYVMPKMVTGTPIECFVFSRAWALEQQSLPLDEIHRRTAERVLRLGGDPTRYGAPSPHPDIAKAGVTGSPYYLNLVAEDRITPHPWVARVEGRRVEFTDGGAVEADAVVVATGFHLNLPFLSEGIRRTVRLTPTSMALADFTFHPDLPGLAFAGLWSQLGPYAVPLEQQARYIAYSWGGAIPAPTVPTSRTPCGPRSRRPTTTATASSTRWRSASAAWPASTRPRSTTPSSPSSSPSRRSRRTPSGSWDPTPTRLPRSGCAGTSGATGPPRTRPRRGPPCGHRLLRNSTRPGWEPDPVPGQFRCGDHAAVMAAV